MQMYMSLVLQHIVFQENHSWYSGEDQTFRTGSQVPILD
jgi:hypothetical protein